MIPASTKWWVGEDAVGRTHVVPVPPASVGVRDHEPTVLCWCEPALEYHGARISGQDPDPCKVLIIHVDRAVA